MSGIEVVAPEVAKGLLGLLFSRSTYEFLFKWEPDDSLVDNLRTQVISAQALKNVADMMLVEDNPEAHRWSEQLKFAILDAEDLMEKILTDIRKAEVNDTETPNTLIEKFRFAKSCVVKKLDFKRKDILRAIHPNKKTREAQTTEIIQKLKELAAQKGDLSLDQNAGLAEFRENRVTTSSDDDQSEIIGRSENERQILQLLKWREGIDDALRVIPIVGMGGVGKSTLASMVYNSFDTSDSAQSAFQVKAWVCVSDVFEVGQVINSLLQVITGRDSKAIKNLELRQKELKKALGNKRFLLVLDDVWITIENKWQTLRNIFSVGAPGSRIIVTTRDHNVAKLVSDCDFYKLNGLSGDECWSLFQRHAFRNGDSSAYPRLEAIGKKIAGKCNGLPLAVKMLGRSLRSKENDEKGWNFVLESKIWNSERDILPSLWLSYYHLPQPVKECFAYLSMFPKDYLMSREVIIHLWVAEGFVQKLGESSSDSTKWEHVAQTYFEHLYSSFFIQQNDGDLRGYVMHDLVHDLAEHVSKGLVVNLKEVNPKSRRLCYNQCRDEMLFSSAIQRATALRTLVLENYAYISTRYNGLFSKFKMLRVLSLERCNISKLPDSIGNMELLKYLNISWTNIECLPTWICHLYNLQILQISCCWKLRSLPARLFDHSNLRHLIALLTPLEQMPDGIGRMKNLQTLSQYVIGEGKSRQMREFKYMCDLSGILSISKLNRVDDPEDVKIAKFESKEYLEGLDLDWDETDDRDTDLDEHVLDAMKPHSNLKRLTINGYGGEKFSNWVVRINVFVTGIVSLHLKGCSNCKTLPPLGDLAHLKYLAIHKLNCVESLDSGFYGDGENCFKALEWLDIDNMEVLKTWHFPSGGFDSLKSIWIKGCPLLTEIPYCFPSLDLLSIEDCNNLVRLKMNEVSCDDSLQDINIFRGDNFSIGNCERMVSASALHYVKNLSLPNVLITFEAALRDYVPEGDQGSLSVPEVDRMKRQLPLNSLTIERGDNLDNLKKFVTTHNLTSLTHITLSKFTSLDSFQNVEWPSTLQSICINDCDGLTTLPDQVIKGCSKSLKELLIFNCRRLECLPSWLATVSLSNLSLDGLEALESLLDGFHNLTSLVTLEIIDCSQLIFPLNGFPDSLKALTVKSRDKTLSMSEMKLQNLNSLTELTLQGFDATFEVDQCFPSSIRHLYIEDFPRLKSLSGLVKRLPLLETLSVQNCPLISHKSWSNTLKVVPEQCWANILRTTEDGASL